MGRESILRPAVLQANRLTTGSIRMIHKIACVDCYVPVGKGGTVYMMMQSFDVPNITWSHLTEEEHEEEREHEEHPPYTEETVKRAITNDDLLPLQI